MAVHVDDVALHGEAPSSIPVTSRILGRLPGWVPAIGDQGIIAITNLILQIVFSRKAGLGALGVYSLISITLLSAMGLSRTLVTDPWLASRLSQGQRFSATLRTLVIWSAGLMIVPVGIVTIFAGRGTLGWLLALLVAPFFVLQDAGRYGAYKVGKVWRSFMSDALLLVGFALGALGGGLAHRLGITWAMGSWLFGYLVALVPVRRYLIGPLARGGALAWWRIVCKPLGMPLLLDSAAYIVSTNITMYLLAGLASPESVGAIRVVNALYPITMVFTGLTMWLVPALTHRGVMATANLRRKAIFGLIGLAVASTAVATWLGPWAGGLLFKASPSRLALMLGGLAVTCNAVGAVWLAVIRVFGQYRPIAWTRLFTGVAMLLSLLLIHATHSVNGYLTLTVIQSIAIAAVAWVLQTRLARAHSMEKS